MAKQRFYIVIRMDYEMGEDLHRASDNSMTCPDVVDSLQSDLDAPQYEGMGITFKVIGAVESDNDG